MASTMCRQQRIRGSSSCAGRMMDVRPACTRLVPWQPRMTTTWGHHTVHAVHLMDGPTTSGTAAATTTVTMVHHSGVDRHTRTPASRVWVVPTAVAEGGMDTATTTAVAEERPKEGSEEGGSEEGGASSTTVKNRVLPAQLDKYKVGRVVIGKVTNLMPYGAFVQLEGGVAALMHISSIRDYVVDAAELMAGRILQVGQEVKVMVTKVDRAEGRLSVSARGMESGNVPKFDFAMADDPLAEGTVLSVRVRRMMPFGLLVDAPYKGRIVSGLLHRENMSHRVVESKELEEGNLFDEGDVISVLVMMEGGRPVLSTRELERWPGELFGNRRGMMKAAEDTAREWRAVREKVKGATRVGVPDMMKDAPLKPGMRVEGVVTRLVMYGMFVDVYHEGRVLSCLVHISNMSTSTLDGNDLLAGTYFRMHQPIQAKVMFIDEAQRRVNLSIKDFETGVRRWNFPFSRTSTSLRTPAKVEPAKVEPALKPSEAGNVLTAAAAAQAARVQARKAWSEPRLQVHKKLEGMVQADPRAFAHAYTEVMEEAQMADVTRVLSYLETRMQASAVSASDSESSTSESSTQPPSA